MTDPRTSPPDPLLSERAPSFWRNLSPVWLVPILAIAVSFAVAWQAYVDRGVAIVITFPSAAGVVEGETAIRFRDVVIGKVEKIGFARGLTEVAVRARIDADLAPYLDEDAVFWVVRPEVSARGISGLSTVLSGVHIEGDWDGEAGNARTRFEGLDRAPLTRPGREGTRITLRAEDANNIRAGAPVIYRGVEVGILEEPRLTLSGRAIEVDAFVEAPHDAQLTTATRFWDASGFSISLGAGGISLDVDSLSTLVSGGLAFDTIYEGGTAIGEAHLFEIYPDESAARRAAVARTIADPVMLTVFFEDTVDGLSPGAPVRYGGLGIGEVSTLAVEIGDAPAGPGVRLRATLAIDPARLGLPEGADEAETLDFLETAVAGGLRARLSTESLLSRALVVELANVAEDTPATLDREGDPHPILPSVVSDLPNFTATAEGVLERINTLPIEDVLEQATRTLASIEALAADEGWRAAPGAAVALLDETRELVAGDAVQAIPEETRAAVAELRALVASFEEGQAVARLTSALASVDAAAARFAEASEGAPALVAELRAVAAKANGLPAEDLMAAATGLLESADRVIGTDGARELPPALSEALRELRVTLAALNEGGVVDNANATLASARDAATAVAKATEGLPGLAARLEALVVEAEGLVGAYGERSTFNAETLEALREIQEAAQAVTRLSRAIERDPNSIILGR